MVALRVVSNACVLCVRCCVMLYVWLLCVVVCLRFFCVLCVLFESCNDVGWFVFVVCVFVCV